MPDIFGCGVYYSRDLKKWRGVILIRPGLVRVCGLLGLRDLLLFESNLGGFPFSVVGVEFCEHLQVLADVVFLLLIILSGWTF